ncbi:MAG: spermine/spermidine N-acetyltransferase [Chitinophagaceae bacterium]|nr:spermine/spermidine N-acetyltransferase [Chitinophagaceae bacterium]
MYTFKLALPSDAEIVCDISRTTFYDTFHEQNKAEDMQLFLDTYFVVENIRRELSSEGNTCILMYESDQLIGYANMRMRQHVSLGNRTAVEIGRIYMIKDKIGRGAGNELMKQCLLKAKESGVEIVWLGVWDKNERAISFYKKWDFEKFSEHVFILGHDVQNDWLMKKEIGG